MKKKGFTLIELIVAIAIISILAAVIAPKAVKTIEKAKVARVVSDMRTVRNAALSFYNDVGFWPGSMWGTMPHDPYSPGKYGEGFLNPPILRNPSGDDTGGQAAKRIATWDGPYLETWPISPWGIAYMWDLNNYDSNCNLPGCPQGWDSEFEHIMWLDEAPDPGPYVNVPRIPNSSRSLLKTAMDGNLDWTHGQVGKNTLAMYGDSIYIVVLEEK